MNDLKIVFATFFEFISNLLWFSRNFVVCISRDHRFFIHSPLEKGTRTDASARGSDGFLFIRVACNTFCVSSDREIVFVHVYVCSTKRVYLCAKRHRVLSFGFTRSYHRDIAPSPLIFNDTGCCKAKSYPFANTGEVTLRNSF